MKRILVSLTALVLIAVLFTGCTQPGTPYAVPDQTTPATGATPETEATPGSTTPGDIPEPGSTAQPASQEAPTGTLTVLVTDAPSYEVVNVVVNFLKVEVHRSADGEEGEGEWVEIPLADPDSQTFDNSLQITLSPTMGNVTLAQGQVEAGNHYTQIRIYMDDSEGKGATATYIPDPEDLDENEEPKTKTVEAKLPSERLKFVNAFEVTEDGETQLLLDFDLQESVVFTGATQSEDVKVIVKPVIKLSIEHGEADEEDEEALGIISGNVTDDSENPIADAEVVIEGATLSATTDENGDYTIADVPVGTYTVTASAEGYEPASQDDIEVEEDETSTVDFALEPVSS
jgi:hypothetical protein